MSSKIKFRRPFVFLCTGMSLDGKISTSARIQSEIAPNDDREMLWAGRIKADAILIGGNQLRLDDPKLTVKTVERQQKRIAQGKSRDPIKAAVVSDLSTIKRRDGDFFETGDKKILFTTSRTSPEELKFFRRIADVYVCGKKKVNLKQALPQLYKLGVKTLMVEGGGELIFSLLKDDLVDEINLKIGHLILGGRKAPTLCDGEGFTGKTARQVKLLDFERRENYLVLKYQIIRGGKK